MPIFRVTLEVDGVSREYLTPLVFIGVGERELQLPTLGARVQGGRTGLHVMVVRRRSGARALAMGLAAAARGVRAVARTPAMDVVSRRLLPHRAADSPRRGRWRVRARESAARVPARARASQGRGSAAGGVAGYPPRRASS